MLQKHTLDSLAMQNLFTNGDVDFKKSNTKVNDTCKLYIINSEYKKKHITYRIYNCDSSAVFKEILVK